MGGGGRPHPSIMGFARSSLLILLVGGLAGCGDECLEPPGTFEPVPGCHVALDAGEDVFTFCTNRPSQFAQCGGPEGPLAQSWLGSLQDAAGPDDTTRPIRVGCGPVAPRLVPETGPAADDCCWLMVYRESGSEACVDTEL